jgi:hypothetical protein
MADKTYTRCWCCSQLKWIALEVEGRLCEDCIATMDAKEIAAKKDEKEYLDRLDKDTVG